MSRAPRGIGSCPSCHHPTDRWVSYFCPSCGAHDDILYCHEADDPRPRSRGEIVNEYERAGMTAEADRLAAEVQPAPVTITPVPERPAPPHELTALTQRSLWDLLDSA